MRNETFKLCGAHSTFLALLMLGFSIFPMSAQPQILPAGAKQPASCDLLSQTNPAAFEPMKEFWRQAWGQELVVDEAAMALQETSTPDHWNLLVSNSEGWWVDSGSFIEISRHAVDFGSATIDQSFLVAAEATRLERWVLVGTAIGSTGNSLSVTAIVSELGTEAETLMRSFSVLQTGADSASSADYARSFVRGLRGEPEEFDDYRRARRHRQIRLRPDLDGSIAVKRATRGSPTATWR